MKKLIALVAAAAFVLSMATMASAAHQGRANLQTSGFIATGVSLTGNTNFEDGGNDAFVADQRVRQYFSYMASENLSSTVAYELDQEWGSPDAPANADQTGQIEIKRAQLKFTWPETETTIKTGIQFISLPNVAIGYNPVLAADMPGVTATTPLGDMADLTVGWTRALNQISNDAAPGLDTFFAALPISQDGYSMAPFGAYAVIGKNTRAFRTAYGPGAGMATPNQTALQDSASAYWLGTNFEMTQMDPIGVQASFIYGSLQADQDVNERSGWYADASVDYKMDMVTPEFYAMYSSGEDDDASDGSETMPAIINTGLTSQGPSMMIGDMSSTGFFVGGNGVGLLQAQYPMGLWTAGFSLKQIRLADNLTATVTAAYYGGTNDEDANLTNMENALTDEDNAYDITASSTYTIYENLSAIMEAGYAKLDLDSGDKDEPATRLALGLNYSF